jgi:predicted peptidase
MTYSQIYILKFSNGTLNAISLNAFPDFLALRFMFSGGDQDSLKEEVNTYLVTQSPPLNSTIFFYLHIYSLCSFSTPVLIHSSFVQLPIP